MPSSPAIAQRRRSPRRVSSPKRKEGAEGKESTGSSILRAIATVRAAYHITDAEVREAREGTLPLPFGVTMGMALRALDAVASRVKAVGKSLGLAGGRGAGAGVGVGADGAGGDVALAGGLALPRWLVILLTTLAMALAIKPLPVEERSDPRACSKWSWDHQAEIDSKDWDRRCKRGETGEDWCGLRDTVGACTETTNKARSAADGTDVARRQTAIHNAARDMSSYMEATGKAATELTAAGTAAASAVNTLWQFVAGGLVAVGGGALALWYRFFGKKGGAEAPTARRGRTPTAAASRTPRAPVASVAAAASRASAPRAATPRRRGSTPRRRALGGGGMWDGEGDCRWWHTAAVYGLAACMIIVAYASGAGGAAAGGTADVVSAVAAQLQRWGDAWHNHWTIVGMWGEDQVPHMSLLQEAKYRINNGARALRGWLGAYLDRRDTMEAVRTYVLGFGSGFGTGTLLTGMRHISAAFRHALSWLWSLPAAFHTGMRAVAKTLGLCGKGATAKGAKGAKEAKEDGTEDIAKLIAAALAKTTGAGPKVIDAIVKAPSPGPTVKAPSPRPSVVPPVKVASPVHAPSHDAKSPKKPASSPTRKPTHKSPARKSPSKRADATTTTTTTTQLRVRARAAGIKGYTRMSRAQLLKELKELT